MITSNLGSELLEDARKKAADYLNIDLSEPRQERRIEALEKLYKKCCDGMDAKTYIYKDNVAICDRLMEIYREQQIKLDDLRILVEPLSSLKVRLENIVYRFRSEITLLENRLIQNQKLIGYLLNPGEVLLDDFECRKRLKEVEDKCWDNWLKSIDVGQELRNTVIGFENRKALLKISKLYIDYHILANSEISKCFLALKDQKKAGIQEYYDILSKYQLPLSKRLDFKVFLQKMIESRFADSAEVKSILGEFAETHRNQISGLVNEVREQYERDQRDIFAVMNFYKKQLINKQVLFTNESETLVLYFKRRYMEKIDLLCSRFQMFNSEMSSVNKSIHDEKIRLFKGVIEEEFDAQINQLKIDYSKRAIPFLDNFWRLEQTTSQKYALDEVELNKKLKDLKVSKNMGMKSLIDSFKADRDELKSYFDRKLNLIENVEKIGIEEFDSYLTILKEECDLLCCEIVNMNARFWTKMNTEFNCVLRRYLIKLRHQYSPYISSWKADSAPWMEEYLQNNLNQETLKAISETLSEFSPESACYKKISEHLFKLNERIRTIMVKRDNVETEQLLLMNTLPNINYELYQNESQMRLALKEECFARFQSNYNDFYNSIITKGSEL